MSEFSMVRMSSSEPTPWIAVSQRISRIDPLSAAARLGAPSFFWESRSRGLCAAGFGVAEEVESRSPKTIGDQIDRIASPAQFTWLGEAGGHPPGPWFGGMAFDPWQGSGEWWKGFPVARWTLPQLLLWTTGNEVYSTAFASSEEKGQALLDRTAKLDRTLGLQENERPATCLEDGATARGEWHELIQSALGSIQSGSLTKIVAARALNFVAANPWNPHTVLNWLRRQADTSTTFLIRGSDGSAFLGATPELLCRVRGRLLETEALAGSAPRTQGPGLLTSEKENREHQAVIDGISLALRPFCEKLIVAQSPSLLDVPHLFHLRTAIQAELRKGSRISQILQALHPTAAVGGVPRDRALRFLAEHENLERGWYAGAIGWWGEESCELMVALRSALIRSNRARLFVGSGIVAGSTEESEWSETEAKSLTMLDALGGGNARAGA